MVEPINRRKLMKALGLQSRIPAETSFIRENVVCESFGGDPVTVATIVVVPSRGRKHRVFVNCQCGRSIPFGRVLQHWKGCKAR